MTWSDKVVLVTGATSGIGRATALAAAREGAGVALVGRDEATLEESRASLAAGGTRVHAVRADLLEAGERERAVEETVANLGGVDLLVNAAGVIASGSIETTSLQAWEQMFALNTTAVFHLMQLALPSLKDRKGSIVNVSSVTGMRSFPGILSYCASKAAVDQLTRCAALELAEDGVRVNAVCPGVVVSQLHRRSGYDDARYDEFLDHSRSTHPLGRVGQPEEIASLILFLGGEEAGWVTGVSMPIDGGRHLTCAR